MYNENKKLQNLKIWRKIWIKNLSSENLIIRKSRIWESENLKIDNMKKTWKHQNIISENRKKKLNFNTSKTQKYLFNSNTALYHKTYFIGRNCQNKMSSNFRPNILMGKLTFSILEKNNILIFLNCLRFLEICLYFQHKIYVFEHFKISKSFDVFTILNVYESEDVYEFQHFLYFMWFWRFYIV